MSFWNSTLYVRANTSVPLLLPFKRCYRKATGGNAGAHRVAALTVGCIVIHCPLDFGSNLFGTISSNLRLDTCSIVATVRRSQFTCCLQEKGILFFLSLEWIRSVFVTDEWTTRSSRSKHEVLVIIVSLIFASTDWLRDSVVFWQKCLHPWGCDAKMCNQWSGRNRG